MLFIAGLFPGFLNLPLGGTVLRGGASAVPGGQALIRACGIYHCAGFVTERQTLRMIHQSSSPTINSVGRAHCR